MAERRSVELVEAAQGVLIEAELVAGLTLQQIEDTETVWRITLRALLATHEAQGAEALDLVEHDHWDWVAKLRAFSQIGQFYGIQRDALMQGLMLLRFDKIGRIPVQRGRPLVYVDYVETAPWNLLGLTPEPRFRGVGRAFLKVAVQESLNRGWEGRVGLHSLPQAEPFYRRMSMTELGADGRYHGLSYFEITAERAIELLAR